MPIKFNHNLLRHVRRWVSSSLLTHQRWWEVTVIGFGLLAGAAGLYWWLWQPVVLPEVPGAVLTMRLDVGTIEQLRHWVTEREQRGAAGSVAGRFDGVFR